MMTPGASRLTITSTVDGTKQPYCLFVPTAVDSAATLPLMVVLHGRGVTHHAWFELTPVKEIAEQYGYVVAAPNGRGENYYEGPGEQDVLDIISEVRTMLPIDADRIFLAGHSMGGWGAWHIGLRNAELFGSISPLAAVLPPIDGPMWERARSLDPFIIHDTGDDIVPVDASRTAVRELTDRGISFRYREETGYAHSSRMIGDNLPRIFEWFNGHRRA
jgi:poly(3-hydroxybutyrate) depolymerase